MTLDVSRFENDLVTKSRGVVGDVDFFERHQSTRRKPVDWL
jgi:hypothetical protein